MSIILAVIGVLGSAVTTMLVSTLGVADWLKAAIIIPAVLLAVYGMARVQPAEPEAKE